MTPYHEKSDLRGLLAVAGEYALAALAIAAALAWPSWWIYPLAALFVGTRQYALAETLTHEAVHGNLCASRRLNRALGLLTTWPFFYTFGGYRRYHLEHHRVDLADPANNIHEQYADWGLPDPALPLSRARAAWLFVARPALGVMAAHHVRNIGSNLYWDRDLAESWLMPAAWLAVAGLAWQGGWLGELVLFWVAPQLLVVGTLDFWSEAGDHYRVRGADTRSDLNPLLNALVAHNIGYHALHHRYPGIPWFNLPRAHAALRGSLDEQPSAGYRQTFAQVLAYRAPAAAGATP